MNKEKTVVPLKKSKELLKITSNGQWILEKSYDKDSDEARRKMIEEFTAKKLAEQQAKGPQIKQARFIPTKPKDAPETPTSAYPEGLRPVQNKTVIGNRFNEDRSPTISSKDQLAAIRARVDQAQRAEQSRKEGSISEVDLLRQRMDKINARAKRAGIRLPGQAAPEEPPKVDRFQEDANDVGRRQARGGQAWNRTVDFLADKETGRKGKFFEKLQGTRDAIARAKGQLATPERLPPQEVFEQRDPQTNALVRGTRTRLGSFHGQEATTRGKVVHVPQVYEDEDGQKKVRMVPRVEQHHWVWNKDEPNENGGTGKWKYHKTSYTSS